MVQGREEDPLGANALSGRVAQQPTLLEDLTQQVRHLTEEVARLPACRLASSLPSAGVV
jgi:uncharacterized coiled-coil protein SlyX